MDINYGFPLEIVSSLAVTLFTALRLLPVTSDSVGVLAERPMYILELVDQQGPERGGASKVLKVVALCA